ncbi:hypothetical protein BD408DRAFT_479392 [Parasitella parasitica]|nr:hypothetical protein BD408DRAFT_479392 [Parasitella parasitica]
MKGVEKGSVFIDITHVKNLNLLRAALDDFNKGTDDPGSNQSNTEFLGRCEKNRTYLNHVFMETLWAHSTASYNTIVNEGIMLSDNTFIKRFPSYSADASISLILALARKDGYYVGGGYATIAIPPGNPCTQDPCPLGHQHFAPLERKVPWEEDDGDLRKITLSWDAMPDFCRCCGVLDHCRADCPDRLSWLKCYNCNKKGHESKHCPRNNNVSGTEAPSKTRAVPAEPKKSSRKTPLKVNNADVSPMIVDSPKPPANPDIGSKEDDTTDNAPTTDATKQSDITSIGEENDTTMTETEPTPTTPKNRSQSPEPVKHKKLPKTQQASDVGDSCRQQHGQHDATNTHESNTGAQQPTGPHTDNHQQDNDQPPPPPQH